MLVAIYAYYAICENSSSIVHRLRYRLRRPVVRRPSSANRPRLLYPNCPTLAQALRVREGGRVISL